jgi:hypothetical protein
MVVGQIPGNSVNIASATTTSGTSMAGAGGGSFVVLQGTSTPIIIAGGGGGSYATYTTQAIIDGQTRERPRWDGFNLSPSVLGTNPALGGGGSGYHGGGGGGLLTAGQPYSGFVGSAVTSVDANGQQSTHGASFIGGSVDNASGTWYAIGGAASGGNITARGGFGGGGGGHTGNNTGGGGGGYSGGHGGQTSVGGSFNSGIGGGSYIDAAATAVATSDGLYNTSATFNGLSITNIGSFNDSNGYIKITKI